MQLNNILSLCTSVTLYICNHIIIKRKPDKSNISMSRQSLPFSEGGNQIIECTSEHRAQSGLCVLGKSGSLLLTIIVGNNIAFLFAVSLVRYDLGGSTGKIIQI